MIEVSNLTKFYGDIKALSDLSFNVNAGEVVGLLGPNGAGKSTTIKILTGYLQPDDGVVKVDDLDVLTHTREIQARIGYLPENAPLYPELTVQTYLRMIADLREIPRETQQARLSEAIYATGLADRLTQPIAQLSKGFRQRVGLAQAILHQPKLLILDEPTIGLDPTQIVEIRHLIRRLARNSTILFSSHILSEVEAVCDRVVIIMNGELKADAKLADLSTSSDAILILQKETAGVNQALQALNGVSAIEPLRSPDGHPGYRVTAQPDVDLCPSIYDLARRSDWPVRELRRDVRTLETVFNQLATAQ
ncbi:MAG: ATP-binding cassette domain-containing protein [Anaerolineales bacterium]|nr:ATP-binding cassette domain-containing protein [Anaerolineales bacterium]